MRSLTSLAFATLLATTGTAAMAEQDTQKEITGPVAMTESQLDNVAAGALVNVVAVDVADVLVQGNNVLNNVANGNRIAIPVSATLALGVLGNAAAASRSPVTVTQGP